MERLSGGGQSIRVEQAEVWLSKFGDQSNAGAEFAYAVGDPTTFDIADTSEALARYFVRLVPNMDYDLFEAGYIVLNRPLQSDQFLAVAYKAANFAEPVGDLTPPAEGNFVLKMLKSNNPLPTDPWWGLEWRNVYFMGQENINSEGFEMSIVENADTRSPTGLGNKTYLEIFGFDRFDESGGQQSDYAVDSKKPELFDFLRGHIIFPNARPFDPKPEYGEYIKASDLGDKLTPEFYDQVFPSLSQKTQFSKFDIEINSSNSSATISLNAFNVLEGSEEVYLNGVLLARGLDYEIDYDIGSITVLKQEALLPGNDLEAKFESAEIFQLDKKTMMGARLEYNLGENAFIGASALFLNQNTIEKRVMVGQEPIKNLVWGVNARYQKTSEFLTSLVDHIPFVSAVTPSKINFEGEIAQSRPNPNTLNNPDTDDPEGVAFIDDFEGSKRVSYVGTMRAEWKRGSRPFIVDPYLGNWRPEKENRAKMIWFNPYNRIQITDILPDKDTKTGTNNKVDILTMSLVENKQDEFPEERPWGSVMKALSPGYFNQTESKYIEFWVNGDTGTVVLDFGLISEDAIENNQLNSEEYVIPGSFENGILDPGEDIGLDMIAGTDGTVDEPIDDDYSYNGHGSAFDDYLNINGTEGNGTGETRLNPIPDTEDLNQNGSLDKKNAYFQYIIHLGDYHPVSSAYITGGTMGLENDKGWRQYRIPLKDFTGKVGDPELSRIEFARLTVMDMKRRDMISFYTIDLVGNKWQELGVAENDTLVFAATQNSYTKADSIISVESVNTEENAGVYVRPPGVLGLIDPITKAMAREQSLQINIDNLAPNQTGAIRQVFIRDQNLLHYRYLKMFVYGDPLLVESDSSVVELVVQIGRDQNNFYEIRKPIYPEWDERNHLKIDLYELPEIKAALNAIEGNYLGEIVKEGGEVWKLKGIPSLQTVRNITVGIKNKSNMYITGKVWLDELRVSEVERTPGIAYRAGLTLALSDIVQITANFSRKQSDFHTLNEKYGTGSDEQQISISSSMNVSRLLAPLRWFNIPVSYSMRKSNSIPKWLSGSDILYSPDLLEAAAEKVENTSQSLSVSISTAGKAGNIIKRTLVDPLSLSLSHQRTSLKNITNAINDRTSNTASLRYNLSVPKLAISPFFFLGENRFVKPLSSLSLSLLPNSLSADVSASQSSTKQQLRIKNVGKEDQPELKDIYNLTANKGFSTSYSPLSTITTSFSRSSQHLLSHVKDPAEIFSELFNDTTQTSFTQTFRVDYNPEILAWLSPSVGYSANYTLANSRQSASTGIQVGVTRAVSGGFSISPQKLINVFYKPVISKSPNASNTRTSGSRAPRRPGQKTPQTPETPKPEEGEEKIDEGGFRINPLYYVERLTSIIDPVKIRVENQRSNKIPGLAEAPGMAFMIGLVDSLDLPLIEGLMPNSSITESETMSANSRIRFGAMFNMTFNFQSTNSATTRGSTFSGSTNSTVLVIGDSKLALPQYSINIDKLEKLFLLNKIANTVRYNLAYTGKKTETWTGSESDITKEQYDWGFRPLVGLNIQWKKGISTTFSMNRGSGTSFDNKSESETKNITNSMNLTTSFAWNTGIKIPLPFFGTKRLQNSVTFSLSFTQNENQVLQKRAGADIFAPTTDTSSWSFRPQLQYSFSSKVTGSTYFEYGKNNNVRSGEDTRKDFGINVLIRIAG